MTGQQLIAKLETQPYEEFARAAGIYEMFQQSAALHPEATALIFMPNASDFVAAMRWTYAELLGRITAAANMFEQIGRAHV